VESDIGEILVDLGYFNDDTNNPPELRLVAHAKGKEYVIWRTAIEFAQFAPIEYAYEVGGTNGLICLCFTTPMRRELLIYEIDVNKTLQSARVNDGRVLVSAWSERLNPVVKPVVGVLRQDTTVEELLNVPIVSDDGIRHLQINYETNKWVLSGDAKRRGIPVAKYYYQYPVGGTGLTFVKKEPVQQNPDAKICNETLASIYYAKNAWAARHDKNLGDSVDTNFFYKEMFKGKEPKCPDGGTYDIGAIGTLPKCSVHGVFKE